MAPSFKLERVFAILSKFNQVGAIEGLFGSMDADAQVMRVDDTRSLFPLVAITVTGDVIRCDWETTGGSGWLHFLFPRRFF